MTVLRHGREGELRSYQLILLGLASKVHSQTIQIQLLALASVNMQRKYATFIHQNWCASFLDGFLVQLATHQVIQSVK